MSLGLVGLRRMCSGRKRRIVVAVLVVSHIFFYLYVGHSGESHKEVQVRELADNIDVKQEGRENTPLEEDFMEGIEDASGGGQPNELETIIRKYTESFITRKTNHISAKPVVSTEQMPILTLITSIKDSPERDEIHRNTIVNWAALSPWVRPVLYMASGDSEKWRNETLGHKGWRVRTVPKESRGIPVLKELFLHAMSEVDDPTPFYGFANADNLFNYDLVETLKGILKLETETLLLVGERTNINIRNVIPEAGDLDLLRQYALHRTPGNPYTQDYFITSPGKFPWERVPDFVLGRPGYDNWLVAKSLEWNITVIDATATIRDVHQSGNDGNKAGWQSKDVCVNLDLIGRYTFRHGRGMCALWCTVKTQNGTVEIQEKVIAHRNWCRPRSYEIKKNSPCVHWDWLNNTQNNTQNAS